MQRARWRNRRATITIFVIFVMGVLLTACGTGATATASPRVASAPSGTSAFVLATLVTGPTETPAPTLPPRPTNTAAPRPTAFPTSTPIPRVGSATAAPSAASMPAASPASPASVTALPRPSGAASASPARAATSAAMNGTRTYTGVGTAYDVRYPDAWTVTEQSGTVTISPEMGSARIAGFLIESVANPKVNPEQDLRDAIMPSTTGGTSIMGTGQIKPVMVAGEPGFRVDVRIAAAATPTARGSATAGTPVYVGSILTTSHKGVNYRIGLFARDGDKMTLDQAEQILASLHFA